MNKSHKYNLNLEWTGNTGTGTSGYREYERSHTISAEHKPIIEASSDPAFRGDMTKFNPEELLVASLSSCHMLWFLHLCADNDIVVIKYTDSPVGLMVEDDFGGGKFTEVTLYPVVTVEGVYDESLILDLHRQSNSLCYIANSVNFPVNQSPTLFLSDSSD